MHDPGAQSPGAEANALRGPPVLIAEGSEANELARLVEALEAHEIGYQVSEGRDRRWRVVIGLGDAFRARAAVAELSREEEQEQSPHAFQSTQGTSPRPLHQLSHYNGIRLVLIAMVLALAVWLALYGP